MFSPWHAACFDVKTGDIEDGPGMKSLKCYKVEKEGDKLFLLADKDELERMFDQRYHNGIISKQSPRIIIVGGGAAGAAAAESARLVIIIIILPLYYKYICFKAQFKGEILMISSENYPPIDRIKLSKVLGPDPSSIALFEPDYLMNELKVELILGKVLPSIYNLSCFL